METQKDLANDLKMVAEELDRQIVLVQKVASETDGLQASIISLNEIIASMGDKASQELIDAVAAVNAKVYAVSNAIKAVDEKVPDAPAETPTDETPAP